MKLTHVVMWNDNEGWQHITPDDVIKKGVAHSVSAKSGLFLCRLCEKYVAFAYGERNEPYFKHNRGDDDKNCPERFISKQNFTFGSSLNCYPIRIANPHNMEDGELRFEMGFILPSDDIPPGKVIIRAGEYPFTYNIEEHLSPQKVTYLFIGNKPCSEYKIETDSDSSNIFPKNARGIDSNGTMFNANNGKMLVKGSGVAAEEDYFLLIRIIAGDVSGNNSVIVERICSKDGWVMYKVRANDFCKKAADFFAKYGYELTKLPITVMPLWPVYQNISSVINHKDNNVAFLVRGRNVVAKVFPKTDFAHAENCGKSESQVVNIACRSRQQAVLAGRTTVLKYTYLWKSELDNKADSPQIILRDIMGNEIKGDILNIMPKQNFVKVANPPFDGFAIVERDGEICERRKIKSGENTIFSVAFGMAIRFYQGLDCVRVMKLEKARSKFEIDELELLIKLKSCREKYVPVSHAIGAAANRLTDYPRVKSWLFGEIRHGKISEKALKILTKFVKEVQL